jgi:hypothetical protein
MAVQQLGPESSRAGARRARALATRAGGPTVALVALSTVTVTSLVALAFAPLPHAVSPSSIANQISAPSNIRPLATASKAVTHTPAPPSVTKTKTGTTLGGSSFTSTPPASGSHTSSLSTGGKHTGSGKGSGGKGTGGGKTTGPGKGGSGGGTSGPTRPGSGGTGTGGSTHGGTGTGSEGGTGTTPPNCSPIDGGPVTAVVGGSDNTSNPMPICVIGTGPSGWHAPGGGHIIVPPPVLIGHTGTIPGGSVHPTAPSTPTAPAASTPTGSTPTAPTVSSPTVTGSGATTTVSAPLTRAAIKNLSHEVAKHGTSTSDCAGKHRHLTGGAHLAGGKHRA